ncbi:LysR family transcriptional regulator [Naumannella cuiyingiana]|uniref:DNA-binding transcriptional LysR family regulator n=1 Tax=Naumannella cuiyingiana TaxID=1347891 RepID=A0A7Z0DAF9_9ACTN|nr:LysR family transcriptional regulator [Naumannella cuiyingiana]NYI71888.1 DNA-binding transcriptional LysR family regulator [Naumannella cuiyingiana]
MLDAQRLTVFRSVIESGSMNRAARQLGYTPSAISQHVAALQRETGLRLLERSGRGVVPTPAGRALARDAARALDALTDLETRVADLRAGRSAGLFVAAFATAGTNWLPGMTVALTREFPEVRVRVQIEEQLTHADQRRPDLAIVVAPPGVGSPPGYDERELVTEPYLAVVPRGHRLAGRRSVRMAELADAEWIDNDRHAGPCRQMTIDACVAAGFHPRFVVETTDHVSAIAFVAAGLGITVVPTLGARGLPPEVCTVALTDPTPHRRVVVHARDAVAGTPVVARAIELLAEQAAG